MTSMSPIRRFNKFGAFPLSLALLGGLFLFAAQAALAADFAGSLKNVSITDSAGKNQPPVAVIKYTKNGDTYTFDASGSSDPDGSIVEYKWDFGDGAKGTGAATSHTFAVPGAFPVTLTVVDNGGGEALSQAQIDATGGVVFYWSMDSLPTSTMLSDFGNVTITKRWNDAASDIGVKGNCMMQTGTRQAYTIPLSTVPATKGRIELYAKHDNVADTTYRYFFKSTNTSTANTLYAYVYKNYIFFYMYDADGVLHRTYLSNATWNVGTWYKYEFVWDADTGYLGIIRDGVVLAESNQSPWPAPVWGDQELFIGDIYPFGSFDEFRILNQ